ncbi:putative protein phosphatase 2C [Lachnellula occidentalis]|uniref:Protein phosphatase n=1 Tax=Lachnellula occidentalis TaxID=215460 RepID=A0A8H8S6P6_9HELO|nr:putative protein phosphatase 2C [Lachnellula occidentalis]
MRRSCLQTQVARAIHHQSRTSSSSSSSSFLHDSSPTRRPESPSITTSANPDADRPLLPKEVPPFRFETAVSLYAKRAPRPFPPPFLSPPSGSFSDPLSTHHRSRNKRPLVNGELIRGFTNGDDAVYASDQFIGANDGVGAWSTRPGGHAGLWSRLILHFWAMEIEQDANRVRPSGQKYEPNPVDCLQKAYEATIEATSKPNNWQGTTTAAGAQLHFQHADDDPNAPVTPLLYVTNLGDSQVLVLRPRYSELVYKTLPQWHWFDCPLQLGTNSPDTPRENAVLDKIEIEENDVVLAMSDGVIDNLWEHEIIENVVSSIRKWEDGQGGESSGDRCGGAGGGMKFVAEELMKAAKIIATDPFAESPFMEHAVEEGLAMEGGETLMNA